VSAKYLWAACHEIVEPVMRPSDSFEQGRVGPLRLAPIAIDYQPQLDTPPFYLHRDEARDSNASVIRSLRSLG
jgi:hypothetical protein